mgnify:FL=1|jgi:hypothetical protein
MIDLDCDRLNLAFKRGVEDGLIEQGMVHAEEYSQFAKSPVDGSEYLWKYYRDGYEYGVYLLLLLSVDGVEVMMND